MTLLRYLTLLALATWLGSLIFFPLVAQTSFSVLPSTHLAGLVVRSSLLKLHWIAFLSGTIFLASSLLYNRVAHGSLRLFNLSAMLVVIMLALTAISQFRIIPRMDAIRSGTQEISQLAPDDPIRREFDTLHAWSTRLEETVLVLGLIALYSTVRRISAPHS